MVRRAKLMADRSASNDEVSRLSFTGPDIFTEAERRERKKSPRGLLAQGCSQTPRKESMTHWPLPENGMGQLCQRRPCLPV
ncbi:hypothetical protein Q5P01_004157 [Channa striata]|uniref:Uncharacterized protein n=1 Tax=Channa striata TaxID=64152 RepID=A0AA88NIW0_CHASR|nr:hypothetical protein Q5P01_004157 [Channa striata]